MVSPSTNFPAARVDQSERSTHTSTNECHHHAGSLPATLANNPASTNGNDGFWFTTPGNHHSEALHSPVACFTRMDGMDGPVYSPIVSDFSFSTSTSTSSLPLSSSSIYFGSMAGSPADFVPMTPASAGSALQHLSPDAEYRQHCEFWQDNYPEWESRECALDITLGSAHGGETDTSLNIPPSLQPMPSDTSGSVCPSHNNDAQQILSAASGEQAYSPHESTYNTLPSNLDTSIIFGEIQFPYDESVQHEGSNLTSSNLLPSGENWNITSSSMWAEPQLTASSELRNASISSLGYNQASSSRAPGPLLPPYSDRARRASSLPAEQTYFPLPSGSWSSNFESLQTNYAGNILGAESLNLSGGVEDGVGGHELDESLSGSQAILDDMFNDPTMRELHRMLFKPVPWS